MNFWTEERIATLRELHCKGRSASQIAKEIGASSRSAVIGKARRLGLGAGGFSHPTPSQPRVGARGPRAGAAGLAKAKAAAAAPAPKPQPKLRIAGDGMVFHENAPFGPPAYVPPKQAWAPLQGTPPVAFEDRPSGACGWPIDTDQPGHWCCGAATGTLAEHDPPYCPTHRQLAKSKTAKATTGNELMRSLRRYAA